MYNVLSLRQIPLFEEFHKTESEIPLDENMENVLDSLTGLVTRKYIIGYAKYLINHNMPFRLFIIDLDNFKLINDNYGHTNGDLVLQKTSRDLIDFVGPQGLCGRFGGDEYIIVLNGTHNYDDAYIFLRNMVNDDTHKCKNVFRKSLKFDDFIPFVTATIGTSAFPEDANNYDDLFLNSDKALYRGKMKGRNCFIIYIEEKHKNIDISKMRKKSLFDSIARMHHIISGNGRKSTKVKRIMDILKEYINTEVTFINADGFCEELQISFDPQVLDKVLDFNGQFFISERTKIKEKKLLIKVREADIHSLIIQKCSFANSFYGYILVHDEDILHLWQENECLLTFVAGNAIAQINYIDE